MTGTGQSETGSIQASPMASTSTQWQISTSVDANFSGLLVLLSQKAAIFYVENQLFGENHIQQGG
jgi:hypothetical protein